jgi:hypothetical protein
MGLATAFNGSDQKVFKDITGVFRMRIKLGSSGLVKEEVD